MNKKIDNLTARLGQVIRVNNIERVDAIANGIEKFKRYAESPQYVSLQVENMDGNGERCLLFTPMEYLNMETVDLAESMTKFVYGRLYPANIGRKDCFLIKIKHWDKETYILRVSKSQLKKADKRAIDHPKSITTKPALFDLFD